MPRSSDAPFFASPQCPPHRQYEALRALLYEQLPLQQVAERFDYTPATLRSLVKQFRAGDLDFFRSSKPGPKSAPKRDAARDRVIALRKQNLSVYDIQSILKHEDIQISHVLVSQILQEEGFAKLPRRRTVDKPPVPKPDIAEVADIRELDWKEFRHFETQAGALFVLLPTLVEWKFDRWVRKADLPRSSMIPALQSALALLSLKLVGKERISHVMDVCFDKGFALFCGLNVIPKTTALSTYSYRVTRDMTASLMDTYVDTLIKEGMLPGESFNLDFHAIMQYGEEAVLEKNYVSRRSRAERSVLAFLVQDGDSRALCYGNATVRRDEASSEILNFVDFWEQKTGKAPPHLVFDSQLTTHDVLDRLDKRGILFLTLRRRGAAIVRTLSDLPRSHWKSIKLRGVSRQYRHVRYVEQSVSLQNLSRDLRQIAVTGLGRDEPTLFLSNDFDSKPRDLVERYAHRMLIENAIAENIDFFHLDALCSSIALQVDLDVMLTFIANALYRHLARHLVAFETATPKQIFRRFLNTPASVRVSDSEVLVRIARRAHHPILLASGLLDRSPSVPWWNGRTLRLQVR
jgi:transposase